jgi:hypothetical protein
VPAGKAHLIFNKLLAPIDNIIVALLVPNGDISGLEPTVGRDRILGRLRVVEVPL